MSIHMTTLRSRTLFDDYWGFSESNTSGASGSSGAPAAPLSAADQALAQEFNWTDQPPAYDKPPPAYFDFEPPPSPPPTTPPSQPVGPFYPVDGSRTAAPAASAPSGVRRFDYLLDDRRPRGRGRGAARIAEQLSPQPGRDPADVGTWGFGRAKARAAPIADYSVAPTAPPQPQPQVQSTGLNAYGQPQSYVYGQPQAGVTVITAQPAQKQPGAQVAPHAGPAKQQAPGEKGKTPMVGKPSGKPCKYLPPNHPPMFMIAATLVEIALYVWELIMTTKYGSITFGSNVWQWGGVSTTSLVDCGGKYASRIANNHEWWRFVSPIFLHVSLPHIGMNLMTQIKIGIPLERSYGTIRMFLLYILCGINGNLLSCIFLYNQVQAGASGALFGLMGILLVDLLQNWRIVDRPVKNLIMLIVTILISLALGLLPGIDNFCHLGGFIMGIVAGFLLLPSLTPKKPGRSYRKSRVVAVLIALPATIAVLVGLALVFYRIVARGHTSDEWCPWCEQISCLRSLFGSSWCGSS